MSEQVYAKTKSFLEWTAARMDVEFNYVNHLTPDVLKRDVLPNTTLVLGETFSNPLMRALDLEGLSDTVVALQGELCTWSSACHRPYYLNTVWFKFTHA